MRLSPLTLIVLMLACQKAPPTVAHGPNDLATAATPTDAAANPEAEFADIRARVVPAVNDRVPSALVAKLKFAPQLDAHNRVVGLVPESWQLGDLPGSLRPPPEANLGASTSIAFGSGCDGRCAPKDWAASFDKVEVHGLSVQQIESDEPIGHSGSSTVSGRIVVARSGDARYVIAGIWKPESARYFYCRATLEGPAIAALPAFVAACRALDVRHWN